MTAARDFRWDDTREKKEKEGEKKVRWFDWDGQCKAGVVVVVVVGKNEKKGVIAMELLCPTSSCKKKKSRSRSGGRRGWAVCH